MKIFSCYSIKGGVGKTALAVNLAYAARESGRRVLLVDLDPQGAAAFYFRIDQAEKFPLRDADTVAAGLRSNVRESDFPGLDVIPSHLAYRKFDIVLHAMKKRHSRLRSVFESSEGHYDIAVVDCPPNITLLSENVFQASDKILVPVIPTTLSHRTLDQLHGFFHDKELSVAMLCPFFSMVQLRNRLHREIMATLPAIYPGFLRSVIPSSADVERMGLQRMPLLAYAKTCAAAVAYRNLCDEILKIDTHE